MLSSMRLAMIVSIHGHAVLWELKDSFLQDQKFMKNETAEILHFQIGTFNARLGCTGTKRSLALQICLFLSSGRSLFWKELEIVKAGDITQRNSHENVYPGSNPSDSYMVLMPSYRKKPLAECQHGWHPSQTSLNWNKWCLKRPPVPI
jgi:hypothetical protein